MKKLILATLVFAVTLSGCTTTGHRFDSSKVSGIHKGVTTQADLVAMFGQPTRRSAAADGSSTMLWMHSQSCANPVSFVPVVGMFAGGTTGQTASLHVILAPDGRVKNFIVSEGDTSSHRGL